MKRMGTVPVLFRPGLDGPVPTDPEIYSLAVQYCQKNLADMPDMKAYARTYIEAEFGDEGQIVAVHGITCVHFVPDVTVFRVTGPYVKRATVDLCERMNAHLSDAGWRGHDAFVRVSKSDSAEQRCEAWQETLKELDAKPAERYAIKVR